VDSSVQNVELASQTRSSRGVDMGHITIKAYGITQYDKDIPDKRAWAIFKEQEKRDIEYNKKLQGTEND